MANPTDKTKPGNQQQGMLSAYLPGQLGGIAGPLSRSFGGTQEKWRGILSQPYSDMEMPADFRYGPKPDKPADKPDGGGNGNGHGGGNGQGSNPDNSAPYSHNSKVMQAFQAMAPQQSAMPTPDRQQVGIPGPAVTAQAPAVNQMFQQPQQQMLSPQVLDMLRQRFGGR